MGVIVAMGSALSVSANAKSSDTVTGTFQYVPGVGVFSLYAKASATGMNCTFAVGGQTVCDDQAIPYTGTAGTLSDNDNRVLAQTLPGGRAQLFFRNTTAGAITVDYKLTYDRLK